jgi:hypothetical protein
MGGEERAVYHDTLFDSFAKWTSRTVGHPATFAATVLLILVWAVTGPDRKPQGVLCEVRTGSPPGL